MTALQRVQLCTVFTPKSCILGKWTLWTQELHKSRHCVSETDIKTYWLFTCHLWFHEEPLTSMKPFHSTKGSLVFFYVLHAKKKNVLLCVYRKGTLMVQNYSMALLQHYNYLCNRVYAMQNKDWLNFKYPQCYLSTFKAWLNWID